MQLTNEQFAVFTDLSIWGDWVATPIEGLSFPSSAFIKDELTLNKEYEKGNVHMEDITTGYRYMARRKPFTARGVESLSYIKHVPKYWPNRSARQTDIIVNSLSKYNRLLAYCIFVYRKIPVNTKSGVNQLLSEFSRKKCVCQVKK